MVYIFFWLRILYHNFFGLNKTSIIRFIPYEHAWTWPCVGIIASTPRRNLRLPPRSLQHDENALFYDHPQYRILRDMPLVYRIVHRRSLRVIYRARRALGLRIWNDEALEIFRHTAHPMLKFEMTIRLVLMRLGFNRDVHELCARAFLPHGTIVNPRVLFKSSIS